MNIVDTPFGITDWSTIDKTEHPGEQGVAYWRTQNFGSIRVRMVEYSAEYVADHWCSKGHILLCLDGELSTELDDGRVFILNRHELSSCGSCRSTPLIDNIRR